MVFQMVKQKQNALGAFYDV